MKTVTKFNEPHFCPDWDGRLIVPNSHEMDSCTCGKDGRRLQSGDKVKTNFYPELRNKIRTVEECFKSQICCQSGWFIKVDGLSADAYWFREI